MLAKCIVLIHMYDFTASVCRVDRRLLLVVEGRGSPVRPQTRSLVVVYSRLRFFGQIPQLLWLSLPGCLPSLSLAGYSSE